MIIGYLLILGGLPQLAAGWLVPVTALAVVGGVWIVAGTANVALSRSARTAQVSTAAPATDIAGTEPSNPVQRARAVQGTRGAPLRGLIALGCAAAALGIGVWGTGFEDDAAPWRALPLMTGVVVGFLSLIGFLVYAASGTERSAVYPATVVVRSYRGTALNATTTRPTVRLTLDVYPQGLTPYQSEILAAVPLLVIPELAVGSRFDALVAGPAKPKNVIVDWDSVLRKASAGEPDTVTPPTAPAPIAPPMDPAARLRELDALSAQGLITVEEHDTQRARILDSL
jgi:hypothetical protein